MIRVLLLGAVVVVAACGSDQDPTLSGPVPSSSSTSSTSPPVTVEPPDPGACTGAEASDVGDGDLALGVTHGTLRSGAPVTWQLTVTNTTDRQIELVFPSGQDGDVVLSDGATDVYRWSDGMSFTQVLRCQVLPGGAGATYELPDPAFDVEPGEYQLRASLAARPAPFDLATEVRVE